MLSILIPTFNYNALPLAKILEQQALKSGIIFELLCIDDGSFSEKNNKNQLINSLTNSKFFENKKNVGSKANRERLAEIAQYNWLLFIDADSKPKETNYLAKYISQINNSYDAIFGGIAYYPKQEGSSKSLRYKFGRNREEIDAKIRNKNPFKVITSANFIIKKLIFLKITDQRTPNIYGLDYLFSLQLKEHNVRVKHINDEVYHLGLDTNSDFLNKTRKAVEALHYTYKIKKIKKHNISLLSTYKIMTGFGLKAPFRWLFKKFKNKIEHNLIGKKPNLFLFDLYRLGYLCSL